MSIFRMIPVTEGYSLQRDVNGDFCVYTETEFVGKFYVFGPTSIVESDGIVQAREKCQDAMDACRAKVLELLQEDK